MLNLQGKTRLFIKCLLMAVVLQCLTLSLASAQLNENCTVSVLNRTANVQPDGSWTLPNTPANMGQVRARATCVDTENGVTMSGQSDLFTITPNGITNAGKIKFGNGYVQVPISLGIASNKATLNSVGDIAQLTVTATFPDSSTANITSGSTGTSYTISNPAIATIDANGLITAVSSGNVIVSASNDMVLSSISIKVQLTGDSDGDGLPDDFELANFLNPNNPVDALEDLDLDGLINLDEYGIGTDLNNPDTDGDSITDGEEVVAGADGYITNPLLGDSDGDGVWDGLEVSVGTDPNDSASIDLAASLDHIEITPSNFAMIFNTISVEETRQLTVTGTFTDGNTIDLTASSTGTNYTSSDLAVVNFGVTDGLVYAGTDGNAAITATNSGFSAVTSITVTAFSPTALSYYELPSGVYANSVDVDGGYAYIAAGSSGLYVVDVSDVSNPSFVSSLDTPGYATDVQVVNSTAYIADSDSGLQIIDISTPATPVVVGFVDTTGYASGVAVSGNYAYIADGNAGLSVIDISVSNSPVVTGTVDTDGNAYGVDVDPTNGIAVVADGWMGVQVIDITNPVIPSILGTVDTDGDARDVVLDNDIAYIADYWGGLKPVDISTPAAPTIIRSVGNNYSMDLVKYESYLFGADSLRNNAATIFDVSTPDDPVFRAELAFSGLRDWDRGTGIDVDSLYLYLTTSHWLGNRLYIGQYRMPKDYGTVPPTVSITSPLDGNEVYEGNPVTIKADATDDVYVAAVNFIIDGAVVFTDTSFPFQFDYTVPMGITGFVVSATAVDLATNVGTSQGVGVVVIPDTPPSIDITQPVDCGVVAYEGQTVSISANATDNTGVVSVTFYGNGEKLLADMFVPYQVNAIIPNGVTEFAIEAVATDVVGQTTIATCTLNVVPDPLTTVTGKIIDANGNPVAGATVYTNGGLTTTTGADGTYTISDVSTVLGDIQVTATADLGSEFLIGPSTAISPLKGGTTVIGNVTVNSLNESEMRLANVSSRSDQPSIAQDSLGNVHLVWMDTRDGNDEIYYKMFSVSGTLLIDDTRLTSDASKSKRPIIGVDSAGKVHIVWQDKRFGDTEVFYTKIDPALDDQNGDAAVDATITLVDDQLLSGGDTNRSQHPSIAIDKAGDVHVVWADVWPNNQISYMKLNNDGTTAIAPKVVEAGYSFWRPNPAVAVDSSNNAHIAWNDYATNGNGWWSYKIFYEMIDGTNGNTLINSTMVAGADDTTWTQSQWQSILMGSDNKPYIVWQKNNWDPAFDRGIFLMKIDPTLDDLNGDSADPVVIKILGDTQLEADLNNAIPTAVIDAKDNIHVTWFLSNYPNNTVNYKQVDSSGSALSEGDIVISNTATSTTGWTLGSVGYNVFSGMAYITWCDNRDGNQVAYLKSMFIKAEPPVVTITYPLDGGNVIEGTTIQIAADATDNISVASVDFFIDGGAVFTDTFAPYQFDYNVPVGIAGFTISAKATDLAGNSATASDVIVNVIPDPMTTATGTVLDEGGNPLTGATVTTDRGLTATSLADGSFSIANVPTIYGDIQLTATADIGGKAYSDSSAFVAVVPAGFTDIGNVIITTTRLITDNTTISADDHSMDSKYVTVDGANITVDGSHTFYGLTLKNSTVLTHTGATTTEGYSLDITIADTLSIDAASSIDVSGKGFLGGYSGGNNSYYGRTLGNTTTGGSDRYSGGSYGGLGYKYSSYQANNVYGDYKNPNELGSGGGSSSGSYGGGSGGGLARIAAGNITLDGGIYANGGGGTAVNTGCGSGGGLYINTGTLSGIGSINASGGSNTSSGGGGGRIAVYYNDITGFDTNKITAYGGDGSSGDGGAGTIYLESTTQSNGDLIVDNNNIVTTAYSTPLRSIGVGAITALTSTVLADANARFPVPDSATGALGLIGLELDPDKNDADSTIFTIVDNTATTITIDSADGDLTTVAAVGDEYIGVYTFDNISVINKASVSTDDNIAVLGVIKVSGGAALKANKVDISQSTDQIFNDGIVAVTEPLYNNVTTLNIVDKNITLNGPLGVGIGTLTLTNSTVSTTKIGANTIVVNSNSVLSHSSATTTEEYRLDITTNTLTIDATSSIDVSGKGYLGGYRGDNSSPYGRTLGNTTDGGTYLSSGGSYGGLGFRSRPSKSNTYYQSNDVYGDFKDPNELGSGGGGYNSRSSGGNGGGLVKITAGSIVLDGGIYADGEAEYNYGRRGGSGGGININVGTLSGTGAIRTAGIYRGGGGRIAVYYDDISGFDLNNIAAYGSSSYYGNAGPGTVYLKSSNQAFGDLRIDNENLTTPEYYDSTPLRSVGIGTITDVSPTVLTDASASFPVPDPATGALGLIGLELDPDKNDADSTTFTITDNTAITITIDAADGDLTTVAAVGDEYIGVYKIGNLSIVNEAMVSTDDNIVVLGVLEVSGGAELKANKVDIGQSIGQKFSGGVLTTSEQFFGDVSILDMVDINYNGPLGNNIDSLTLTRSVLGTTKIDVSSIVLNDNSTITHPAATTTEEYRLDITTDTLTIDATSGIDVSGKGYLGGYRGGKDYENDNEKYGNTLGNTINGGSDTGGGSYGGLGSQSGSKHVNSVYGSYKNPNELGSGGGGCNNDYGYGGNGGGLVRITTGIITLDGRIRSNSSPAGYTGGGSGGGVYINTGTIKGVGSIAANGGDAQWLGGGGGRVAVYYDDISGFDVNGITAYGGNAYSNESPEIDGGAGTVYLKSSVQTHGDLIVDNNNLASSGFSAPLVSIGKGSITGLSATVLTDVNAAFPVPDPATGALGLKGLELDPNINDADSATFTVTDNTATTITIDSADGDLTTVASIGDVYVGVYTFDDLRMINMGGVSTSDNIVVLGVIEVSGGGGLEVNKADLSMATDQIYNGGIITSTEPFFENVAVLDLVGVTYNGPLGHIFDKLTLSNSALTLDGSYEFNSLTLRNNAFITHSAATSSTESLLDLTITGTLTIDATSSIDVSGKGYLGGYRGDNSSPYGRTLGNTTDGGTYLSSGGSYGGLGFRSRPSKSNTYYQSNDVYGDFKDPNELGSGGGGYNSRSSGGNGGGLVKITAGSIVLDGGIYADGEAEYNYGRRGGSGGGININVGTLSGTGAIRTAGIYRGGGGRIAVYYDDISGFDLNNIAAYGSSSYFGNAGSGTVYLKSSSKTFGDLRIDNNNLTTPEYFDSTPLRSVGIGTITAISPTMLTDANASFPVPDPVTGAMGLKGLELDPNVNDADPATFTIVDNTATTITIDIADGDLATVGSIGDEYVGVYRLDDMSVLNDASIVTGDNIVVHGVVEVSGGGRLKANKVDISQSTGQIFSGGVLTTSEQFFGDVAILDMVDINYNGPLGNNIDTLTLTRSVLGTTKIDASVIVLNDNSTITHPAATTTEEYRLDITTDTLTIDATSGIDVSGKGYLGGYRGGKDYENDNEKYGNTLGNTINGGSDYGGGSYGGLGSKPGSYHVNSVYGSYKNPNELGSGGGGCNNDYGYGGNGGGLVRITTGIITLDGRIRSNSSPAGYTGGGSGGGVYISTGTITGVGSIAANGGEAQWHGGGGGRVALYYDDISGFDVNGITAYGGNAYSNESTEIDGGAGTVYLKSSVQTYGDLIVDNNYLASSGFSTPLVSIGTGVSTVLSADTLTDATRSWSTNELTGIYLNPSTSQGTTPATVFKILSNDATSITVDNTLNNLTDVASTGNTYIGEHYVDNLSVINGAKVETEDRIIFNSLFITGGELQAENIYQIGKAETSPIDKLAKHQKNNKQRVKDRRGMEDEGLGDRRSTKVKVRLMEEGIQTTNKEFKIQKVKFLHPGQQPDEESTSTGSNHDKIPDRSQETAKLNVEAVRIRG